MDPSPQSEVLCEGWMVKSPPLEAKPIPGYSLFKAVSIDIFLADYYVFTKFKVPIKLFFAYRAVH